MEKVLDKIFVEFLIPSVLMFLCILLVLDLLIPGIDFNTLEAWRKVFEYPALVALGLIVSYIVTTSLSACFNLVSRRLVWGRVRAYIIYRKLDVFKNRRFDTRMNVIRFLWTYELTTRKVKKVLRKGKCSLHGILTTALNEAGVPAQMTKDPLDIYDSVRTLVMASRDNAVISWISYHWSHLRLARSTLVPIILFAFLIPAVTDHWGYSCSVFFGSLSACLLFFVIQLVHYYYRERFMIYSMLGYFLVCPLPNERG